MKIGNIKETGAVQTNVTDCDNRATIPDPMRASVKICVICGELAKPKSFSDY